MKTLLLSALSVLAIAAPAAAQDNAHNMGPHLGLKPAQLVPASDPLVERGRYVAVVSDCAACHTAPDGGKPFAGGYAIKAPMGDIISTNITPSKTHGIGSWTEAQFAQALRKGVAPRGNLYPAMPYTAYSRMSDEDVHALWIYLNKGVAPVDDEAKQVTHLSFPFGWRFVMSGWNMLFAGGAPAAAQDTQPGGARRGEYLVNGPAHCGTCHTPRNVMMAEESGSFLAGADVGGWHAPNITSDPVAGIGAWSEDDLVRYLRDGSVPGKAQAAGPMAEAVSYSFRHMSDADLHAMARYLKTVPAHNDDGAKAPAFAVSDAKPVPLSDLDAPIDRDPKAMIDGSSVDGQRLYMGACASCHQPDGKGTADQFYPSLTNNSATGGVTASNLVMAIIGGVHRDTNNGTVAMPAFGAELNDAQVAAVANYVLSRFGNHDLKVSEGDVTQLRAGGPTPLLVRAIPYLMLLAAIAIAALGYVAARRRRAA